MATTWDPAAAGLLRLPSGRLLRGRALRRPLPDGPPPDFAIYLLGDRPAPVAWEARWVRWPDYRLPTDRRDAHDALGEAWRRAGSERVEIACGGGRGRTGSALACVAVLDGMPAREAVAYVREHYDPRAVETPWQRRYVARLPGGLNHGRGRPARPVDYLAVHGASAYRRAGRGQDRRERHRRPGPRDRGPAGGRSRPRSRPG